MLCAEGVVVLLCPTICDAWKCVRVLAGTTFDIPDIEIGIIVIKEINNDNKSVGHPINNHFKNV